MCFKQPFVVGREEAVSHAADLRLHESHHLIVLWVPRNTSLRSYGAGRGGHRLECPWKPEVQFSGRQQGIARRKSIPKGGTTEMRKRGPRKIVRSLRSLVLNAKRVGVSKKAFPTGFVSSEARAPLLDLIFVTLPQDQG